MKRQQDAGTFFSRAMQVTNVTKENAYCVIQLANTSSEVIKLQAGTVVANVEEIFDEIETEGNEKTRRVLGMNKCPKQLDPKVKEQNKRVPHDTDLTAYVRRREGPQDVKEQVDKLAKRLRKAREAARGNIIRGKEKQREHHDKRAVNVEYQPGQLVYRKQMVSSIQSG
jgi:hypothetical protein